MNNATLNPSHIDVDFLCVFCESDLQAITDLSDLLEETTKSDPSVAKVFARLQVNDLPDLDQDTENSPCPSF